MDLKTDYVIEKTPHFEYPRPQLVRDSYLCLNGEWDLYKKKNGVESFCGKILVPFSPESINSGIAKGFKLEDDETLIYKSSFELGSDMLCGSTVIHFGAVDCECSVHINSSFVCSHKGGYTPFSVDIAPFVNIGINDIVVECRDDVEKTHGARGKQHKKPGGIWYTAQSGIWQSVWIESMPKNYIKSITVKTAVDMQSITLFSDYEDKQYIRIFDGDTCIFEDSFVKLITVKYGFELWSPENPKLYDLELTTDSGDRVRSYFGVRTFGVGKDKNGISRLLLNGKPYFFNGILDQGYWSDGLLTHPCDKAIVDELTMLKNMGFNMIRKHIKLEPLRWYYHCDRLGIVVWQDFVNGGGEYKFTHIAAYPFLKIKHNDSDYKYFSRENEDGRQEYEQAVYETVNTLKNCTCIGAWVPFNEGWGQFDSAKYTQLVKSLDDTRIVDSVSGWYDQGIGKTELVSLHIYFTSLKLPKDPRPIVLSEFGGFSLKTEGHVYNEKRVFGYKRFGSEESLIKALEILYLKKLLPLVDKGLCACVYTQVSDVEEEINGLVTYDRKHIKVPVERMKRINDMIKINE